MPWKLHCFSSGKPTAWRSIHSHFQNKSLINGHNMEYIFTSFTNKPLRGVASNVTPKVLSLFRIKSCTGFVTIWLSSRPVSIISSLFCVRPYPAMFVCSWIIANPQGNSRRSQSGYKPVLLVRLNFSQVCSLSYTMVFRIGVVPTESIKPSEVAGSIVKAPSAFTFYQAVEQKAKESAICQEELFILLWVNSWNETKASGERLTSYGLIRLGTRQNEKRGTC